jgi:hypothetical protein
MRDLMIGLVNHLKIESLKKRIFHPEHTSQITVEALKWIYTLAPATR